MAVRRLRAYLSVATLALSVSSCKTPAPRGTEVLSESATTRAASADAEAALRDRLRADNVTSDCPARKVCLTILQLNDVYEIGSVSGGRAGGLDRVAKLRRMLRENPRSGPVVAILAGDLLSPSGLGSIKENDKVWAGKQMVSVLKAAGLDFVMFGNHEFDLKYPDLQARLDESVRNDAAVGFGCGVSEAAIAKAATFGECPLSYEASGPAPTGCLQWLATNVFKAQGTPVPAPGIDANRGTPFATAGRDVPRARILTFTRRDEGGQERTFQLGLLALTILINQKDYQQFAPVETTARAYARDLRSGAFDPARHADAVIAITHLNRADDVALLNAVPEIDYSIGGHDHASSFDCVGDKPKRCVAKADANARSVYLHRLVFDPDAQEPAARLAVASTLVPIDDKIPRDPDVTAVIDCWFRSADRAVAAAGNGIRLNQVIAHVRGEAIDGNESKIRNRSGSNLIELYARSMLTAANAGRPEQEKIKIAFINGGVFRIDDHIGPGDVTYYEAVRTFPASGDLVVAKIKVSDLAKILRRGWKEVPAGSGAILHLYPRIAQADAPGASVDEQAIAQQLAAASGLGTNINADIEIVSAESLLRWAGDLKDQEKQLFRVNDSPTDRWDMRQVLISGLQARHPANQQGSVTPKK